MSIMPEELPAERPDAPRYGDRAAEIACASDLELEFASRDDEHTRRAKRGRRPLVHASQAGDIGNEAAVQRLTNARARRTKR